MIQQQHSVKREPTSIWKTLGMESHEPQSTNDKS